ncbi:AAA family ATPase [Sporosarcina oncorhynchi]|uniref:AAA family ATPase n=1 Tax=Sporosarcina oncorhynchi TaxID=3056444 RepID=A0ABZ0L7J8_9BACL|nr:right-handed parallel beta-helix repeat-containing protein [Sporosarcina sp. T2O-4]WOV88139.1 AAA family ATPase [Sporosarcina sp. T2O-4]
MANLQVSQRNTSSYKTIQAAVNAALPGDTVEVGEGVYDGHLFVDKSLVLKSASGEADSVRVTGSVRIATTEEVRIESISIEGAANSADDGVHIESGDVTFHDCLFSEIQGVAMRVEAAAKVAVSNSTFQKNIQGIDVVGRLSLFECIVEDTIKSAQIRVRARGEVAITSSGILSGQEDGLCLSEMSRATITKSSFIGNRGVQLRLEQDSSMDIESTKFYVGHAQGIYCDQSTGVLKNCVFKNQRLEHVAVMNGSRVEVETSTFESGEAEGMNVSRSIVGLAKSLFKNQQGDHITCNEQSHVSMTKTEIISGKSRGIVTGHSTCTLTDCEVKYNQLTQLSAFQQSVLTIQDCEIESGSNKGVYATGSEVNISDSLISHHSGVQVFASDQSAVHLSATEVKSGDSAGVSAKESELTAANCIIFGHKGSNVLVNGAAKAELTDCKISSGDKNGILAGPEVVISLERTIVFNHKRPQVRATECAEVFITECEIYDGRSSGIVLSQVERTEVTETRVHGHSDDQIVLQDCSNAGFNSVQVMNGKKAGLRLERSVPVLNGCSFNDNRAGDLVRWDDSVPVLTDTDLQIPPITSKLGGSTGSASTEGTSTADAIDVSVNALTGFIGLEDVKDKIQEFKNLAEINQFRLERGMKVNAMVAPHMVFQGNPGTGKTTVARLIGQLFKELGLLKSGHVIEVKREDLVGTHVGESEERTKVIVKEAMGGVLFIDEAYTLAAGGNSSKDFGKKVIETLLPAMEDARGEFMVIVAGYTEEMDRFLASNPGLKDRFTERITFQDYTPDELLDIFLVQCKGSYALTPAAKQAVYEAFVERYRMRDETFSNARMVRMLYDQIGLAQSMRIAQLPRAQWTEEVLTTFEEEDVLQAVQEREEKTFEVPIDEVLLAQKRAELHQFIGLDTVKAEIDEMIELMRYYRRENQSTDKLMNHTLLIGKPGTGKTEVGRVLAGIYQALGLLKRGDLIEVDRSDLVGSHIGETEKLTAGQIERSIGSALFIDEAYTLAGGGENDFGKKAVEVLLKKMSDRQGEFLLIAAGYEEEMNRFLDSNAGLRRRFGLTLHFDDYTPEELMEITELYIKGYGMTNEAKRALVHHYEEMYARRDSSFGNAGLAKKIAKEMTRKVDYRMAVASNKQGNSVLEKEITRDDLVLLES